jgi:flagellar biosynthesis/type III secretory pathway protein FliH
MTLARARILKGGADAPAAAAETTRSESAESGFARARVIPAALMEARAEAERIVAEARECAAHAAAEAAQEARAAETAHLAAGFIALRDAEARRLETDKDRLVELATLLAERLLGEALRVEPQRIAAIAAVAIDEARGAKRIRISASPEDVAPLQDAFAALGIDTRIPIDVEVDPALARGSLVLHTDLGRLDARLEPQLQRLATALREALR